MDKKKRVMKVLKNIHHVALDAGDDMLIAVSDVAIALFQDRPYDQVWTILEDRGLADYENEE